jgi:hypothetical protein
VSVRERAQLGGRTALAPSTHMKLGLNGSISSVSTRHVIERLDVLISEGRSVLRTYNQHGNIDRYDLWWTEAKNFLSVNLPELVPKFTTIVPKYRDALLSEPFGRAAYNLIQEHLEVLLLAKSTLLDAVETADRRKLQDAIAAFFRDSEKACEDYEKNVFLMTRFQPGNETLGQLDRLMRDTLASAGLVGHRADDRCYTADRSLWDNVCTYMQCCSRGIAVLEDIIVEEFNPNVALEYGFMRGLGKPVLLLKERRFHPRADILGTLWEEFDILRLDQTVPTAIDRWLNDIGSKR